VAEGETVRENSCENLIMCIITTLNKGLRSGGGIGDVLRVPSTTVCSFSPSYISSSYNNDRRKIC
jgi:hypothetical protein